MLESEAPSAEPDEDTVMAAFFATSENPPPPPREHAKRRKGREKDEARARKKERCRMEACRIRAVESAAGVSSSKDVVIAGGTANSAVADKDTTEGVQSTEVVGSGEPDPPTC